MAERHGVHPSEAKEWRSRFEEGGKAAFRNGTRKEADQAAIIKGLHAVAGTFSHARPACFRHSLTLMGWMLCLAAMA